MKITIKVPKVKSYQTLVYKNGFRSAKKKDYKDYLEYFRAEIDKLEFVKFEKVKLKVTINLTLSNKRRIDLDNITKAILDILQELDVIDDDFHIDDLHVKRVVYKQEFEEIEIKIEIKGIRNDNK